MSEDTAHVVQSVWEQAGGNQFLEMVPDELLHGGTPLWGDAPPVGDVLKTLDGQRVFDRIAAVLGESSTGALAKLGLFCGILLLCSLWQRYRESVHDGDTGDLFSHITTLFIALSGMGWFLVLLQTALRCFQTIHVQVTAALSTLTALSAMRGMVTTASVTGVGMAFFLAVCETLTSGVLPVFIRLCAGLSLASSVGGGFSLGGLSELIRRQFLWLVGALMSILTAVLSFQTVLAQKADSVSMRAVKFTLSGVIPIIGGAVGDAAATVASGFSLLTGSVGILGIVVILWQILPPLCTLLFARMVFSLSGVFASSIGLSKEEGILRECASLTGFLCAVMAAEALLYILMLSLCMKGM